MTRKHRSAALQKRNKKGSKAMRLSNLKKAQPQLIDEPKKSIVVSVVTYSSPPYKLKVK